jgi:hypothetical protein
MAEGEDRGQAPGLVCSPDDGPDNFLVAQVEAVKFPDTKNQLLGQGRNFPVMYDFHIDQARG